MYIHDVIGRLREDQLAVLTMIHEMKTSLYMVIIHAEQMQQKLQEYLDYRVSRETTDVPHARHGEGDGNASSSPALF